MVTTVEIAAAAQLASTIGIIATLLITSRRNHKSDIAADTTIKTELSMEIKSIKEKLEDSENGLGAISHKVGDMKTHCAEVTAGCAQRWEQLAKEKAGKQ